MGYLITTISLIIAVYFVCMALGYVGGLVQGLS